MDRRREFLLLRFHLRLLLEDGRQVVFIQARCFCFAKQQARVLVGTFAAVRSLGVGELVLGKVGLGLLLCRKLGRRLLDQGLLGEVNVPLRQIMRLQSVSLVGLKSNDVLLEFGLGGGDRTRRLVFVPVSCLLLLSLSHSRFIHTALAVGLSFFEIGN